MNGDFDFSTGAPSSEMEQYLQMYLDETTEQMDALVESLLVLEAQPTHAEQLNESFRLIHSIKGSSALMGLDGITVLTHHLENHFERLRSGLQTLDRQSMGVILRCVDFLRECNDRLRAGETLKSAPELLEELGALSGSSGGSVDAATESESRDIAPTAELPVESATSTEERETATARPFRLLVQFEPDLPLMDLKAELVLTRLEPLARIDDTRPPRAELERVPVSRCLEILLTSDRDADELRLAADVDGVALIEVEPGSTSFRSSPTPEQTTADAAPTGESADAAALKSPEPPKPPDEAGSADGPAEPPQVPADTGDAKAKVAETVRVDISRLDDLMNLAGELVVNKARFVQIARQMSPAFRKSSVSSRARSFGDSIRRAIGLMKQQCGDDEAARLWAEQLHDLEVELDALEEQSQLWERSRRGFMQITEAIDQMSRVSNSLQRGVLDTRMVPVAPLFNRFKRVVRDIALELGKQVRLEIHGENTELDKRMIDELGDPLVHLVRNAIDHGIESGEVRARRGKPEVGTLTLEAAHSGNNVYITVRDDGGGINLEKVRQKIVDRGLLTREAAAALADADVAEYIWHPGFSTADAVSDLSGRGVGMDIVKTRIAELNGAITVQEASGRGTTFTIRLPLTLAIIRSLLFRVPYGIFAVPIENVREIVSVPADEVLSVHGRQTFDVRGTFLPLVSIDDLFEWHGDGQRPVSAEAGAGDGPSRINVVILHSGEQSIGLRVDELHGSQEIVIKSLAENFIHIRGLAGASILGDGSVCLLLDAGAAISLAADPRRRRAAATVG